MGVVDVNQLKVGALSTHIYSLKVSVQIKFKDI